MCSAQKTVEHLMQRQAKPPDIFACAMKNKSSSISSSNIPAWMVTFADLMALMMTFFVLLYSFSKVDEEKYKSIVNSMAKGFDGVQWIKRRLIDGDIIGPEPGVIAPLVETKPEPVIPKPQSLEQTQPVKSQPITQSVQSEILFAQLNQDLEKEIATGLIYVEQKGDKVVIRFPENVSFTSGSDQLVQDFVPIVHRISTILKSAKGKIMIAGHTDDRPISTNRFRSNWELSISRAVSVAHHLLETHQVDRSQVVVAGHADTQPLEPNNSHEQRAKNRRVEISVFKDESI